jgi:hypothetical protein
MVSTHAKNIPISFYQYVVCKANLAKQIAITKEMEKYVVVGAPITPNAQFDRFFSLSFTYLFYFQAQIVYEVKRKTLHCVNL